MSRAEDAGPPLSPCIRVCQLDAGRQHCLGCHRSVAEIASWWSLPDAAKRAVLQDLPRRAGTVRRGAPPRRPPAAG